MQRNIGTGPSMTEQELLGRMMTGGVWAVGEYRNGKCESIKWRDKTSGKSMEALVGRHTIECGADTVTFSPRLPEDYRHEEFGPLVPKGTRVAIAVQRMEMDKGNVTLFGTLHEVQS